MNIEFCLSGVIRAFLAGEALDFFVPTCFGASHIWQSSSVVLLM
jgi:hypothetical protein